MVRNTKIRLIIQAPSGTDLSTIEPKLPKKSTLEPLKHLMVFGKRTFSYFVPNDGCKYILFRRNCGRGIRASTLQERLGNEELVVKDVLDFGEKEIFCQKDEKLEKERKQKDKEISKDVVRDTFHSEEEEIFQKKGKKLKQELQEKVEKIAVLTEQIKEKVQENETLQKTLLQSLEKQVYKARKEHLKRFQEERFAQDMDKKFY